MITPQKWRNHHPASSILTIARTWAPKKYMCDPDRNLYLQMDPIRKAVTMATTTPVGGRADKRGIYDGKALVADTAIHVVQPVSEIGVRENPDLSSWFVPLPKRVPSL